MCMAANLNSKRFALLHLFILSSFLSFSFQIINKRLSERELSRSSSPFFPLSLSSYSHQQYLDINGKKRKKHNKQRAKTAVVVFLSRVFFFILIVVLQIHCFLKCQ